MTNKDWLYITRFYSFVALFGLGVILLISLD
jgi:hypothetical protein